MHVYYVLVHTSFVCLIHVNSQVLFTSCLTIVLSYFVALYSAFRMIFHENFSMEMAKN